MTNLNLGILHPGQMGISVATTAQNSGQTVYWVSEGRSQDTLARASEFDLLDARTLPQLCEVCSIIISVCPPHAAEELAKRVVGHGFKGIYVDANAISPQRAIRIDRAMTDAGASFVDGGIIGGPAWEPGTTWLYLSGKNAERIKSCFTGGPLETSIIGESIGKASALKMCYAAYTKGTTAMLCAILAAAEMLGVKMELEGQWSRNESDFSEQVSQRVRRVSSKAWRFAGEMEEIAATFEETGLPSGFHSASADIYRRITHFKDASATPSVEKVLAALVR